jgi:MoaA/NifB/PqqE/SkfB family radical SAM enzyme
MSFLPLTYECNQRCIFCSAPHDGGRFALRQWLEDADKLKCGALVQLSGGEPFTLPPLELLALLKHCAARGLRVEFQSNGTPISSVDDKLLKAIVSLVNSTGGYFNVNTPAHSAALDFKITGLKDGFAKRIKGIEMLVSCGAKVRLTHVVLKTNMASAEDFVKFAVQKLPNIEWVQFSFVKAFGSASGKKEIVPSYEAAAPQLQKAFALATKLKLNFDFDHIPPCYLAAFAKKHVDWNKIPSGAPGPHIKEKTKTAACKGCAFFCNCAGARKDYLEIYRDWSPPRVA